MDRKTLVQEYFVLAVNENGNMQAMHKDEGMAGIVVAGYVDLLLNGIISMEKKKINVVKELTNELEHISSLYTYLREKPRSTDKLMNDYMMSMGGRIRQLTEQIGESLVKEDLAVPGKGGLFGKKTIYIPQKDYKNALVDVIKSEAAKKGEISPHDMALICILNETKNLNQYFSKYESSQLKAKLKEMKKNPENKQLADMIGYVSDMTAVMAACILTSS